MNFSPSENAVNEALFAYSIQRANTRSPNTRIAYYTTSETALKIIQSKKFWLRNPQLMNDFEEVQHGRRCLAAVLSDPEVVQAASQSVDAVFPGAFAAAIQAWENLNNSGAALPFVACLSEIDIGDNRGRLSMWRAYGGNNGVALVLNNDLLELDANFVNTFHSPVLYGDAADVKALMLTALAKLAAIPQHVTAAGQQYLQRRITDALQFAMLSIKHVGFEEEREWRMIHHYAEEGSFHEYESQVVRGNAEVICAVNLAAHPQLAPGVMFEKVIVGPCMFPRATAQALSLAFHKAGNGTPTIVTSDIPLRHI